MHSATISPSVLVLHWISSPWTGEVVHRKAEILAFRVARKVVVVSAASGVLEGQATLGGHVKVVLEEIQIQKALEGFCRRLTLTDEVLEHCWRP